MNFSELDNSGQAEAEPVLRPRLCARTLALNLAASVYSPKRHRWRRQSRTQLILACALGLLYSPLPFASLSIATQEPIEARQGAPAQSLSLAITHIEYSQGCASIGFVSPQPNGPHQLQVSEDLKQWQSIPIAVFEKNEGSSLRATMAGLGDAASFFRLALLTNPPSNAPVYVNLQIDAELDDAQGIRRVMDEVVRRKIAATVYVSADYANRNALYVHELFAKGFEIALHGYYTGEQLASMTYEEQKNLLSRAKLALEGCRPCGTYKPITGFRPQYFSQNEDTYLALDEQGFTHNSGFKLGQLYLPGHTWDAMPYQAAGHNFAVIPITTVPMGCDRVYLCDLAGAQVLKWTPAQWREALLQGLAMAVATRQPLVVLLHGYLTGDETKYGYWQPFIDFLDAAESQATFLQSKDLIERAP